MNNNTNGSCSCGITKEQVQERAQQIGVAGYTHHIFVCGGKEDDKGCCKPDASHEAWEYLKRRIKELRLEERVGRTKTYCLRLCGQGPVLVVYPQGVWYTQGYPENIERILQEHIIGGQVVEELCIASPVAKSSCGC